jgi:choline dehydrogenase
LEIAVTPRGHGRGIERLVVADASVMPEMQSVNTNLPTIMVAERLAAWLRED